MKKETLKNLIDLNMSQREIAANLNCSQATVKHWLKKYGISTSKLKYNMTSEDLNERLKAKRANRVKAVQRRREKIATMAIEYKGDKCIECGYNKCSQALDFHHVDPTTNNFGISAGGHTRSWEKVKEELDKCVLLCANCHREVHAGILNIGE